MDKDRVKDRGDKDDGFVDEVLRPKGQINALHVHGGLAPNKTIGGRRTWLVTTGLSFAAGLAVAWPDIAGGASAGRIVTIWMVTAGASYFVAITVLKFGAALYRRARRNRAP